MSREVFDECIKNVQNASHVYFRSKICIFVIENDPLLIETVLYRGKIPHF